MSGGDPESFGCGFIVALLVGAALFLGIGLIQYLQMRATW